MKLRMEDVKPYTVEELTEREDVVRHDGTGNGWDVVTRHRLRATVEALEACKEALADFVEYERKRYPPRMGGDEYPPSLAPLMKRAREALEAVEGSTTNHREHP